MHTPSHMTIAGRVAEGGTYNYALAGPCSPGGCAVQIETNDYYGTLRCLMTMMKVQRWLHCLFVCSAHGQGL